MNPRWIAAGLVATALLLGGCGTSGGSEGAEDTATTAPETPSSTAAPSATAPTPDDDVGSTTSLPTGAESELPDCQELLRRYSEAFDPTDMSEVIELFRSWAPSMPDDVGAATLRLADAYDAVDGDLSSIDMGDVDLTADAEAFSDWTNDGCPTS